MTVKQKAARAKFTKAIAEAKKLRAKNPKLTQAAAVKQAFAILYSKDKPKKVGAVKKKAAPKKKAAVKKAAPKKKAAVKITEKDILNKIHKVKRNVENLDEAQHAHMIGAATSIADLIYLTDQKVKAEGQFQILKNRRKKEGYLEGFDLKLFQRYPGYIASLKKQISEAKKHIK
jgi:hypothetical protein